MKTIDTYIKILTSMLIVTIAGAFLPLENTKWMGAYYSLLFILPAYFVAGRSNSTELTSEVAICLVVFFLIHKFWLIDNSISWLWTLLIVADLVVWAWICKRFFKKPLCIFFALSAIGVVKSILFIQLNWLPMFHPYLTTYSYAYIAAILFAPILLYKQK